MQCSGSRLKIQIIGGCAYALGILVLSLCCTDAAMAQTWYSVLTNDSASANTVTAFRLNTSNGSLSQLRVTPTKGESAGGPFYGAVTQAITPDGICTLVSNGKSSTISTFYHLNLGNYSNPNLVGGYDMPLVANQYGGILYAAYYNSSTLGVWYIDRTCQLTLANYYNTQAGLSSLAITHDGKTLLATYNSSPQVESWAISGPTLTSNGVVTTSQVVSGLAVTADDKVVVMGTTGASSTVVTASLPGFTNRQTWNVGPGYSAESVALSAGGAAGNGCLYVGNSGNGNNGMAGVTGALFQENPLAIAYVNNQESSFPTHIGNVATISNAGNGGGVYAAETIGNIAVYSADSACAVKLVRENSDPNSHDLYSLTSWQN